MTNERGAYTVDELAARVGASPKSVWKWYYAGRLRGAFRAGRAVRFDRATVERRLLSGELLIELPRK